MDGAVRRSGHPLLPLWHLLIAAVAVVGLLAALTGDFDTPPSWAGLEYFSQLGTLAVALTALGAAAAPLWRPLSRGGPPVLRAATASWTFVTLLVFATLLGANYSSLGSKLEHLAVPLLALLDVVLVGRLVRRVDRPQQPLQWWWPLVWLAGPLLYLPLYIAACIRRGRPLYPFLDPETSSFVGAAAGLLVGFLVSGALVWGAVRLRERGSTTLRPDEHRAVSAGRTRPHA